MQKAKESNVVVEDFLNDLLCIFKTLTEISREFVFSIAYFCCLLLIFIATSSTSLSRGIYTLLAFIDLGFPVIRSLETLKIQRALWAVSALCQAQSHKVLFEVGLGAWGVDRTRLCPVCKINIFIPYRWLTQAPQLMAVFCRGSSASANLNYLLGSLTCILLCGTSVPTVKL